MKAKSGEVTWRVRFRRTANGRQVESSETFTTEREAIKFAKLLDALGADAALAHLYGSEDIESMPTASQYAAKHIESITRITDGTRQRYKGIWRRVWAEPLGDLPLDAIDRHLIAAVVNRMSSEGVADKTIANAHGLLAAVMKGAVIDRLIEVSPCVGIKLPRASEHEREEPRFLTEDEFGRLVEAVREIEPEFAAVALFLAGTGCRWGELEALAVGAVDLKVPSVRINRAAKAANVTPRPIGPPKTVKSNRTIVLPNQLVDVLKSQLKNKQPDDLVFTDLRGRQLSQPTFWRVWDKARKAAKLDGVRIHDLRHSHASWLLSRGVPIHVVSARLGHESIQTTVDTYGHLMPDMQALAANAAGLVFSSMNGVESAAQLGQ